MTNISFFHGFCHVLCNVNLYPNFDKHILFFCENNNMKKKVKNKYQNILITNSKIGHTSLPNTTNDQILDTITDFYIDAETGNYKTLSTGGFFSRFFITVFPP